MQNNQLMGRVVLSGQPTRFSELVQAMGAQGLQAKPFMRADGPQASFLLGSPQGDELDLLATELDLELIAGL